MTVELTFENLYQQAGEMLRPRVTLDQKDVLRGSHAEWHDVSCVLQYIVACCSVLQCVVVYCNVLRPRVTLDKKDVLRGHTLSDMM